MVRNTSQRLSKVGGSFHKSTYVSEAERNAGHSSARELTRRIWAAYQGRMTVNAANSLTLSTLAMLALTVGCAKVNEGGGPSTPTVYLWSVQQRFQNYYFAPVPALDPLQWDWSDTDPPIHTGVGRGAAMRLGDKTLVHPD
jgi:hypothetical protein